MSKTIDFPRYLAAKKTVDDRALNRNVWEQLRFEIAALNLERPLRILELGCGIGTLAERQIEWGLADKVVYLGIDEQAQNIEAAPQRVFAWGRENRYKVAANPEVVRICSKNLDWQIQFLQADVNTFQGKSASFDLIIAQAFLDLIDVPKILPKLKALLSPGGLFYFTINFDGDTIFEPVSNPVREKMIIDLYHRSMDERIIAGLRSGDSQSGRHLFAQLKAAGAQILAAGSSDWVVFPQNNDYPSDEAYFLHCILDFFEDALGEHPELKRGILDSWLAERRTQIENGEMVYIAHQLDFLGRF